MWGGGKHGRCQRVINEDSGQPLLKSKLVNKTWRVDRPGWWRANSKVELKKNNCSKRQFYGYQINLVQRADRRSDHPGKHRLSLAGGQTFTSSDKCPFKKASCCIWEWKPFMVLMKQEAAGRSHYQLSRRWAEKTGWWHRAGPWLDSTSTLSSILIEQLD